MSKEINRFIDAQNNSFNEAFKELSNGNKKSHWIWYIFPQLKGLGYSYNSNYYGLDGINEAKNYWGNEILRSRYLLLCDVLLRHNDNIENIMGDIDSLKLHSSLTLFYKLTNNRTISRVIDKFYNGLLDNNTLKLINEGN